MVTTIKFLGVIFVVTGLAQILGLEWLLWMLVGLFVLASVIYHFWSIPNFKEWPPGPQRLGGVTADEMFMLMVADQQQRLKNRSSSPN
jgi:hypothetical protein